MTSPYLKRSVQITNGFKRVGNVLGEYDNYIALGELCVKTTNINVCGICGERESDSATCHKYDLLTFVLVMP